MGVSEANRKKCNEDLDNERKKCTFNPLELTHFLDGGAEKTKERKDRETYFLSDAELQDNVPDHYLSHADKYRNAVRKSCIIFRKIKELQAQGGGVDSYRQLLGGQLGGAILKDGNPLTLHYVMFIPTLMSQGTLEQQALWISRAWSLDILGTYAQTELGHGTFIRGLETTATYDPSREEFVLNSPTLTSYKWWPGGLGHTANYAVVVAQLISKGEKYGIHPFVVQLRDENTHMPMPGIVIGEIGTKMGMNATNNGYLGFENVRIPRDNMLMKNAQVLPDGTYIKSPNSKLTYGTMVFVRVVIVQDCATFLSKAVTIATRYSAVRRQSEYVPGEREPQIIDYRTQQYKLFPHLATCFAMKFAAGWIWDMYNNVSSEIEEGDLDKLPELHAMSCCMKAVCSADASWGVEILRLSCGGHGYMTSSNLPSTYGLVTAACTYEGENTVLLLQTARYLMKAYHQASSGQEMTSTVAYLRGQPKLKKRPWANTIDRYVRAFKEVAAGKIVLCAQNIERRSQTMSPEDAWNMTSIELTQCSEAHCRAFLVERFAGTVAEGNFSVPLKQTMEHLCELYAVFWMLLRLGDFLMFTSLTTSDVEYLRERQVWLLQAIRPQAVGLVDGFDLHDMVLGSALGAWDGQVYERLFEEAQKSPLNAKPVDEESFYKYLKPLLKANL
ncbi:probable peroxisomal acyl-coenzyme A oxidase 1 [Ischnura elegans]|uniref:probable peroxisomal acyl-coenzyme A oxidase 1 n=1 Tax=Ischnura elegans TaxID=197161 RepID=UPI001ED8717B|nr:probable peroxisomal acyl-coenzyme A oxidase 1 [Ischnura elegans]